MIRRPATPLVLAILSVVALVGCRKKPAAAPEPTAASAPASDPRAAQRRADSTAAADRRTDSLASAESARRAAGERAMAEVAARLAQPIYFDYDRDQLRDDARAVLDAKIPLLLANASVTLVITGHTDERGTAEYNLALGQRRAAQVKRYLVGRGIPDARLTTQSLGDSQPAAAAADEASYQQNRRAEFEAQGVDGALRSPGR